MVAAEFALPKAVAQDHNPAAVGRVLLRCESPSQYDGRAIHAEVALRNVDPVDLLRMATGEVEAGARIVECHHLFEQVLLPLKEVKLGDIVEVIGNDVRGRQKLHHAVGVGIGERLEQHRVDDGEDGRVGADAQGKGGNRSQGEAGVLEEHLQ